MRVRVYLVCINDLFEGVLLEDIVAQYDNKYDAEEMKAELESQGCNAWIKEVQRYV